MTAVVVFYARRVGQSTPAAVELGQAQRCKSAQPGLQHGPPIRGTSVIMM